MTLTETRKALKRIERVPNLRITGQRAYSNGLGGHRSFSIDVTDRTTGYSFTVNKLDDLEERGIR